MFEISLIGATRLTSETTTALLEVGGVKPRQILEMLALSHRNAVSKEALAEALWDGNPPAAHAATLESHVSVIRRHLRALGVPRDAICTVHDGYLLSDAVAVDVSRLRSTLREALQSPTPALVHRAGLSVPPADVQLLSSSPYAAWAISAREALDGELAHALRLLAGSCAAAGDLERATCFLERAQQAEPLSELTEQQLLGTLAARGARVDALVSFERYRRRLREELGADPGAETSQLHLDILRSLDGHVLELQERERGLLRRVLLQLMREGSTGDLRTHAVVVAARGAGMPPGARVPVAG